ncbi:MAG TPA: hypothetical protein VH682_31550 [Gemmataceae bacterium]|jgi:hypothetical protein
MKTKFVAGILMAVASLCFFAVDGTSQSTVPGSPTRRAQPAVFQPVSPPTAQVEPTPPFAPAENAIRTVDPALVPEGGVSLEQLVQQLRYVRQQQKALEAQEEELLKRIDLKVEEQRQVLRNADELRKQLRQEKGQVGKKADAKEPNLNRGGKQ